MSTKPMVSMSDLRPGDLLLHASKGEISKLIMWASDSDYSHIAMVFEPGLIAEARSAGVLFAERLDARVQNIGKAFHFIDVLRPRQPDPLPADVLQALQESARRLEDAHFALNQMLELGLICALRNKMPGGTLVQRLVGSILARLVRQDPTRLVCSEFLYLAYRDAQTEPPGLLAPRFEHVARPDRPFPADFDLWELLREYQKASGAEPEGVVQEMLAAAGTGGLGALASSLTGAQGGSAGLQSLVVQARQKSVAGLFLPVGGGAVNPELTLPQDFADSASFTFLGTLVP